MGYTGRIVAMGLMLIRIIGWTISLYLSYREFATAYYWFFIPEGCVAWWLGLQYDKARYYSQKDVLTGVFNRRFIEAVFPKLAAKADRSAKKLTLMLVDVDNLKHINDSLGHKAGDESIRQTANLLISLTRKSDFVARWGGDEFIVVAPDADNAGGAIIFERLKGEMHRISIGTAVYPDDGTTFDALLHHADHLMYQAKSSKESQPD